MVNDIKLVSVVIPVLNNADGFERAINSVLKQSYPVEIIVIDGGSTDGTLDRIKSYLPKVDYWETGEDAGIADAFNRGINVSSGEMIAILNSDDYWEPDTLQKLFNLIQQDNVADIYAGAIRYHNLETEYQYIRFPKLNQLKKKMHIFHPAMFVRKGCYECVGPYLSEYTHAMDAEWVHRAISKNKRFATTQSVLANMSLGGVSDKEYRVSLVQYRESLIKNKLCSAFQARYYYFIHLYQKRLLIFLPLASLKKLKDKWCVNKVE